MDVARPSSAHDHDSFPLMAAPLELDHLNVPRGASASPSVAESADSMQKQNAQATVGDGTIRKEHAHALGPTPTLRRSSRFLLVILVYTILAVLSWAIVCILAYRPISFRDKYNAYNGPAVDENQYSLGDLERKIQALYAEGPRWLEAARVMQSVVAVLTIPLTSAVCAKAAVVFTQHPRKRSQQSLRKTVVLANRGWMDLPLWARLCSGGYHKYGSPLLLVAILLIIIGTIIPPLQSLFLNLSTTKTSTYPSTITDVPDILDFFENLGGGVQPNIVSVFTRSSISSTFASDLQSWLWTSEPLACSPPPANSDSTQEFCPQAGATLATWSSFVDPFVAPLPGGFNTGLITQFAPRLNSSVTREFISDSEFPANCDTLPGAFYAHYYEDAPVTGNSIQGNWSLMACMPADQSNSPWNATRDRQDISETLYLNISVDSLNTQGVPNVGIVRITLNSTLGYFELPNYSNGQLPGPLLSSDPFGEFCPQGTSNCLNPAPQSAPVPGQPLKRSELPDTLAGMSSSAAVLQTVDNNGPLLNLALALFGQNSYVANRFQNPGSYVWNQTSIQEEETVNSGVPEKVYEAVCVDFEPMTGLFTSDIAATNYETVGISPTAPGYAGCISVINNQNSSMEDQLETWLLSLTNGKGQETSVSAWEAAAFLANQAWLLRGATNPSLEVSYDLGVDTEITVISLAGIIFISVLMGLFHIPLLILAWYGTRSYAWVGELDAFVMMRVGAAMTHDIPFAYVDDMDKVEVLDSTPGWVGDASEDGHGPAGGLGLGAPRPLKRPWKAGSKVYIQGKPHTAV